MSRDSGQQMSGEPVQKSDDAGVTRRRLLVAGAASWATVGLAGCSGGEDETTTQSTTESTTEEPTTAEPEPKNYVVTAETGTGSVPEGVSFASSCSPTRTFVPGMMVTWQVGIFDPETGEQLTDEDLESVTVNVEGGPSVDLAWAGDDEENPAQEWGGSWDIPADMDPGEEGTKIPYTVEVEVSDGDANFQTVGILEDAVTVVPYEDPVNYVVTTETFYEGGPDGLPESTNGFVGSCAPERHFTQDFDVTFKIGIYDADSGGFVGTDQIKSAQIVSPDDKFDPVSLEYYPGEGEDATEKWQGALDTANLEPGTYNYEVEVTYTQDVKDAGKDDEGDLKVVGIASDAFTIIEV